MIHFWCYCHIKFCFHLQPQKVFLFMIVKAVHKQSSFIVSQEFVGKEEKSSRHLLRCYKGLFVRQLQKSISLFLSNNLLLWQPNQTNIVLSNWLSDGMPFKRHSRREMWSFLCASSLSYNFTFRYHSEVSYKTDTFSESFCSPLNCLTYHLLMFSSWSSFIMSLTLSISCT